MNVLITGAGGWTAEAVIREFAAAGHQVYGLDVRAPDSWSPARRLLAGEIQVDIAQPRRLDSIVRDAAPRIVLHLAVATADGDYSSPEVPFRTNVLGTYNLLEAARRHGAARFILISSAPVHLAEELPDSFAAASDWRSGRGGDHLYDLTKRLQEVMTCDFAATYDLAAVILRAGHIVDGRAEVDPKGRPLTKVSYCRGGWVCRYDLARACLQAGRVELSGCHVFHAVGAASGRTRFGVDRTEKALGMTFEKRFEDYE